MNPIQTLLRRALSVAFRLALAAPVLAAPALVAPTLVVPTLVAPTLVANAAPLLSGPPRGLRVAPQPAMVLRGERVFIARPVFAGKVSDEDRDIFTNVFPKIVVERAYSDPAAAGMDFVIDDLGLREDAAGDAGALRNAVIARLQQRSDLLESFGMVGVPIVQVLSRGLVLQTLMVDIEKGVPVRTAILTHIVPPNADFGILDNKASELGAAIAGLAARPDRTRWSPVAGLSFNAPTRPATLAVRPRQLSALVWCIQADLADLKQLYAPSRTLTLALPAAIEAALPDETSTRRRYTLEVGGMSPREYDTECGFRSRSAGTDRFANVFAGTDVVVFGDARLQDKGRNIVIDLYAVGRAVPQQVRLGRVEVSARGSEADAKMLADGIVAALDKRQDELLARRR